MDTSPHLKILTDCSIQSVAEYGALLTNKKMGDNVSKYYRTKKVSKKPCSEYTKKTVFST
jgi:hypothetical protein